MVDNIICIYRQTKRIIINDALCKCCVKSMCDIIFRWLLPNEASISHLAPNNTNIGSCCLPSMVWITQYWGSPKFISLKYCGNNFIAMLDHFNFFKMRSLFVEVIIIWGNKTHSVCGLQGTLWTMVKWS